MASTVSLENLLDTIPVEKRHLLDHKLEDSIHLANIARVISDWPTVLLYLPNLKPNDEEAIQHDHRLSYERQKIALLRLWKERNGPYATYRQLASCLHKAGKIDAVQALCEQLGAPASAMTPAPTHTSTQPLPQPQPVALPPVRQLPEPTMRDLVNMVHTTRPYELGLELNINERDLELARVNYHSDVQEQLREVLQLYRRQTVHPSWLQVASALQTIGDVNNAATIAEKYGFALPQRPGTEERMSMPPSAAIPSTAYTTAVPHPMYAYHPYPPPGTYPPWAPYQVYPYPPPQQPVEGATSLPFSTVQQLGYPGTAASGSGVVLPANLQPSPHPTVATGVPASSAPTTTTSPAAHQLPTQAPAGRVVQKKERGGKPDLVTLEKFPHPSRDINIMQEVVPQYKRLGKILLKDPNGVRVLAMAKSHAYNVDDVVYDIFQTWLVEDAGATWGKLVQCLKEANLNSLAEEVEGSLS